LEKISLYELRLFDKPQEVKNHAPLPQAVRASDIFGGALSPRNFFDARPARLLSL
jgi:hypothetical protein